MGFGRIFWLLLALALAGAAQAEERFALLIGNSRYEQATPLRNPENDIKVVAESLRAVGFKTTLGENADLAEMKAALKRFVAEVKSAERPVVLFYFAGHGVQRDGTNFLLPVDVALDDPDRLAATALEADAVMAELGETGASLRIVVMDACRDNPFQSNDRGAVPLARGLAEGVRASGQILAYSTAPGKTATDGDTGTSPYATAFAEAVLVPGLTVRDVFDRVREKVSERTRGAQEPWETAAVYENIHFVPPADKADVSEVEALLWDKAALLDSAEAYQRYVTRFPQGRFVPLAKQKIENINRDFSFRKQAEIFPIVATLDDSYISFCGGYPLKTSNLETWWQFQQFDGQVVYVDLVIPFLGLNCANNDPGAPEVIEFVPTKPKCGLIPAMTAPSRREPTCRTARAQDKSRGRLDAMGGQGAVRVDGGHYSLTFSALSSPYYRWEGDAVEGQPEFAFVRATGLVRVDYPAMEEEGFDLALEPVDPAELGLTWKYQNTIKAFNDGDAPASMILDISDPAFVDEMNAADETPVLSYWSQDGQVLALRGEGDYRAFNYVNPSPELVAAGLRPGSEAVSGEVGPTDRLRSLLRSGEILAVDPKRLKERVNDGFVGSAYALVADCAPEAYELIGYFEENERRLVLGGQRPRLNERCETVGSDKVEMTLDYLAGPNPPPAFRLLLGLDRAGAQTPADGQAEAATDFGRSEEGGGPSD